MDDALSPLIDNSGYYIGSQGHSIMNSKNFSSDIKLFLDTELAMCSTSVARGRYRYLVEFGCDHLRLAPASIAEGIAYFGVDIRKELKFANHQSISVNKMASCRFVHAKAERIVQLISKLSRNGLDVSKGLLVLPFNFFGNVRNPSELVSKMTETGLDVLISQFSTTPRADQIRLSYYESCGISGTLTRLAHGHVFLSAAYSSFSYHPSHVRSLMSCLGYLCHREHSNDLFHIDIFKPSNITRTDQRA